MPDPIALNRSIKAGVVRDEDAADPESIESEGGDPLADAIDEIIDGSVGIEAVAGAGAVVGQLRVVRDEVVIDGGVT